MAITSILVPLFGDTLDTGCLNAARWAAAPGTHVTAQFVALDPLTVPMAYAADGAGYYMTEEFVQALTERNAFSSRTARESFDHWAAANNLAFDTGTAPPVTVEFIEERGESGGLVRARAVVNDLAVAALPGDASLGRADVLETLVFGAGRPVLAIPAPAGPSAPDAPAVVAWNGRAEAARALTAALPLLRRASHVTVIHAGADDSGILPPVIAFLARHGITAAPCNVPAGGRDAGAALLGEAERCGAGLLVFGAYGHSRARELIFGGVTRHILHHAKIPVLLAH